MGNEVKYIVQSLSDDPLYIKVTNKRGTVVFSGYIETCIE